MELEEDRLSSLPKIILHHILSRLPVKDGARTSVLSKAWLDTWYTFPILSFYFSQITGMFLQPMDDSVMKRNILEFCDYVNRRMLRFRDQNLTIKEFKLKVNGEFKLKVNDFSLLHMAKNVDIWLKLACECGVEVIEYSQEVPVGQDLFHVLPISVVEAKSLTKLALGWYIKIDPKIMNDSIKFCSLRVLSLCFVLLGDEHAFNHLLSFCPLIEYITLRSCLMLSSSGGGTKELMKSLSISGLQKLKRVDVIGIRDVYIDAPSLESFLYSPNDFGTPFKIDFDRCGNLKELYLRLMSSTFFSDKWFPELFLKFPFLESLILSNCEMPERVDISSVRLKELMLSHCSNLKEVNIDAPNLLSFGYNGTNVSKPTISFLRNSSQLKVNIDIKVDYVDLCNLREFVQNIQPNSVLTSLTLSIDGASNVDALDLLVLQVSSPPPRIKHLDIRHVPTNEYLFSSLVNILLTSCCPTTISLRFDSFQCGKPFIEFFYETLMRRKDDECSCSSDDTKCWWHGLKDVKITSSLKIDENVDFKTILESLPARAPEESISFRLEF